MLSPVALFHYHWHKGICVCLNNIGHERSPDFSNYRPYILDSVLVLVLLLFDFLLVGFEEFLFASIADLVFFLTLFGKQRGIGTK